MLTGKFTTPGRSDDNTRLSPDSVSTRDHAIARAVQDVAAGLGATASQVVLSWTMSRSVNVHPIVGVRPLEQLRDNLGALDVSLPPEAVELLEAAATFDIGFPNDFIGEMPSWRATGRRCSPV